MNNTMDEKSINDRDTITNLQGKKQQGNVGKAIALVILFSVCLYLAYSTLATDKNKLLNLLKKELLSKQNFFAQQSQSL